VSRVDPEMTRRLQLSACVVSLACGWALLSACASAASFVPQAEIPGYGGTGFGQGDGDVSLSADGNTALVGDNNGGAWVFTRSGSTWSEQASLHPPYASQDQWGHSAALSADGNTAIVGGGLNGYTGRATVFIRSGSTWTEQTTLNASGSGSTEHSGFGFSVSISADGNTALIGGPYQGPANQAGAAWVFTRTEGRWTQFGAPMLRGGGEITSSGISTQAEFGARVTLSGDGRIALVGAEGDNESRGAAWLFEHVGGQWLERGKITAADEFGSQRFGHALALSANGDVALIGGEDAMWLFERAGNTWVERGARLRSSEDPVTNPGHFGWSVALSADGNTAVTGASALGERNGGAAWILRRSGATWEQQRINDPNGERTREVSFGDNVAISGVGTTALISAPGEWTRMPAGGGAAWAFVGPPWSAPNAASGGSSKSTQPVLTHVTQSHRRWRERASVPKRLRHASIPVGTTFSFTLNEPAVVVVAFTQRVNGRPVKGACVTRTRRTPRKPACTRRLTRGSLAVAERAGRQRIRFDGRLRRGERLPPGNYNAVIAATSAGLSSSGERLSFAIVR
jgi:FG-GAP repeat